MKNEFIILEQPKKLIFSVIIVDVELPVSDANHKLVQDLSMVSDLFFIFPIKSKINTRTFASLYKSCGYIEAEDRSSEILMRTLEYDLEIFKSHDMVLLTQLSNLPSIKEDPEKLQRIVASDINKPIFKMRNLESQEFFEIYQKKKNPWWKFSWITKTNREDTDNSFCSETSESNCILVRPGVIKKWLKFWKENPDYIHSFSRIDQRFLIASVCKKLEIEPLGVELDELEL